MHHRYLMGLTLAAAASVACGESNTNNPGAAGSSAMSGGAGAGGSAGAATAGMAGGGAAGASGGSTAGGGAGGSGGTGGSGGGAPELDPAPTLLSKTGLFTNMKDQTLGPGVYYYEPAYVLWSDGAEKKRWVYMPPGGKIKTDSLAGSAGMEFWTYPKGFKLWKEFKRDGKLIETRYLQKNSDGLTDWYMVAFKWNEDHTEATALPDGEANVYGTQHDIPSTKGCNGCHTAINDNALGFSALQLSHNIQGSFNLAKGVELGWFNVNPPAAGYTLPGTDAEKKAIGYLHSNCGICHNSISKVYGTASLDLWAHLDQLDSVQTTRAYLSMVCDQWPGPNGKLDKNDPIKVCDAGHATGAKMDSTLSKDKRVVPKMPLESGVRDLMALRSTDETQGQMPPIGTELKDDAGLAAIDAWINGLP